MFGSHGNIILNRWIEGDLAWWNYNIYWFSIVGIKVNAIIILFHCEMLYYKKQYINVVSLYIMAIQYKCV